MISKWDEARIHAVTSMPQIHITIRGRYINLVTEGDKLQEEKNAVLKHHVTQEEGIQKEINELKGKLESIRDLVERDPWGVMSKIKEVLGDE